MNHKWTRGLIMYCIILHEEGGRTFAEIAKKLNLSSTPAVTTPLRKAGFKFNGNGEMIEHPDWYQKP